jgi:hypothetical protein
VSRILDFTNNNYLVPFGLCANVYLVALGIIHLLLPRLEPMVIRSTADEPRPNLI